MHVMNATNINRLQQVQAMHHPILNT